MNNLERLIRPKSIAVVGGNDKMGSFGNFSMKNVMQNKGNVRYYVVNSRNETVCGLRAYKTLSDLPEVPDCIMICTPKSTVPELLTEAGELGVGAAIIVASGYDEDGTESGRRDAEKLGMIAEKYRMKVMGPNCTGFINNIDKIKLWGMGGTDFDMETRRTGVATFANSGTMALHSIGCPYLRISYAFSMGNCTYLSIEEVLEYILEDENVHVIGIYFEGTKDPARLLKCFARAEELDKPIVVHAAGISKKGAAAASSHTGNLASSKAVYEALFKKYGVIMVENTDEYLCALDALSIWHGHMPKNNGFSAYNGSGGETTVCADMSEKWNIPLPDFQPETVEKLKKILPEFASPKNPLDATAVPGAPTEYHLAVYNAILSDPNIDICMMTSAFNAPDEKWDKMGAVMGKPMNDQNGEPIVEYMRQPDAKAIVVMPSTEDRRDEKWRERLAKVHVPIFANSNNGYIVLGKLSDYIRYKKTSKERTMAHAVPRRAHKRAGIPLTEYASKEFLKELKIPMPRQTLLRDASEIEDRLKDFSYPIVMKISSEDIPHKTEAGGVKLGIRSAGEAQDAYRQILANCRRYSPNARLEGVLAQETAKPGTEMILGVTSDSRFGPMIMVGMGGVFVEIFGDVAMYPCPINRMEALEMLRSLKCYRMLTGYRGAQPLDIEAMAEVMVKLSYFAAEHRDDIRELDLNPVFLYPEGEGVSMIDALVIPYND